jgi:CMP-2-keto-3-deoxyoctulosonic acid synthetase
VLADIGDKPTIQPVLERCRQVSSIEAVVLCTDSSELNTLAEGWGSRALYFSRSAIPYVCDVAEVDWHQHTAYWGNVGIYGFRGDVYAAWISQLEKA